MEQNPNPATTSENPGNPPTANPPEIDAGGDVSTVSTEEPQTEEQKQAEQDQQNKRDDTTPANTGALRHVLHTLASHFPFQSEQERVDFSNVIDNIHEPLDDSVETHAPVNPSGE
jgi:hypothetical protein